MASPLMNILTRNALAQLAGPRSFSRGEAYFAEGAVRGLAEDEGVITAKVQGTRAYKVALRAQQGRLGFSCTCPAAAEGGFCKHAVAVGLAWLAGDVEAQPPSRGRPQEQPVTLKDVRAWVEAQSREALAALVMEALRDDDRLRQHLFLEVAKAGKRGVNLATFRAAIEAAAEPDDFIGYREAYEHAAGIEAVIDSVEVLLRDGHAAEVVELAEYALGLVEASMGMIDDSSGTMGGVLHRLQGLHLAACKAAEPDPAALAERLFSWELRSDFETFLGAAQTYAAVLGKAGLARYRELAEAEWAKVPPLAPGGRGSDPYPHRFRITHLMETLARQTGDVEALVAIKRQDLSYAYSYLGIAELYRQAGQPDRALEWAERGLAAFPDRTDSRLREFLADEYHRRGRHQDAVELAWANFAERPALENYRALQAHADQASAWPATRDRALAFVREQIGEDGRRGGWRTDRSRLVEIYLWEKDAEAAWREATEGGCAEDLWQQLAAQREEKHPQDAIAVYQRLAEAAATRKNNQAYEEARGHLKKIRGLMVGLGQEAAFARYLASVRAAHKPKRNLMKLLDAERWD